MACLNQILAVFTLLVMLQHVENRKKSRTVYFLDSRLEINPKYVKYMYFDVSRDRTAISILLETEVNITQLWGTAGVSIWQKPSREFRSIINYDIDLCETLLRIKSVKIELLNTWVSNVLKYGNISDNCPYLKNVYYIDNMKVDRNSIPAFTPTGKYQASFIFYRKLTENDMKEIMSTMELTLELK